MVGGGIARAEHVKLTEEPFVGVNDDALSCTWSGASNKRTCISLLAYYKFIGKKIIYSKHVLKLTE